MGNITRPFRVTLATLAVVWGVFAVQQAVNAPSAFVATAQPSASWVLAPLAHASPLHIAMNSVGLVVVLGMAELRHGSTRALAFLVGALYLPFVIGQAVGGFVGIGASAAVLALVPVAFVFPIRRSPFTDERVALPSAAGNAMVTVFALAITSSMVLIWLTNGRTGSVALLAGDASHVGHAMGAVAGVVLLLAHLHANLALAADLR